MVQEEYLYKAMGQRVVRRITQVGKTIHVVHDLDGNRLAAYEIDNVTGAQVPLQEYVWFEGPPVAVVDGQTDEVFFVRTDHIGRPVFATDDIGIKVEIWPLSNVLLARDTTEPHRVCRRLISVSYLANVREASYLPFRGVHSS